MKRLLMESETAANISDIERLVRLIKKAKDAYYRN